MMRRGFGATSDWKVPKTCVQETSESGEGRVSRIAKVSVSRVLGRSFRRSALTPERVVSSCHFVSLCTAVQLCIRLTSRITQFPAAIAAASGDTTE